MVILIPILFVLLLMISAVSPRKSTYSEFERKRRADQHDVAERDALRHELYHDIRMWLGLKEMILMIALTQALAGAHGIGKGILYALIAFLLYRTLARIPLLSKAVQKLYDAHEAKILSGAKKLHPVARVLYKQPAESVKEIASRDELEYIIEHSSRFLKDDEKGLIVSAFSFADKKVGDYMTPRAEIDTINDDEILGPLVLDDLHKTGHSQFPVIVGDLDQVVGILSVSSLLTVRDPQSLRVKNAMIAQISYVHESETLSAAYSALLDTKQQLLIVINQDQETVGVLSLSDITHELFGRDIASQFGDHESRTAVAARQPR